MNNLVLKEKQEFMGIQIPVIEGGFGEGQKVVLVKTIAEIHNVELRTLNVLINNNLERFNDNELKDILNPSEGFRDFVKENELLTSNRTKNIFLLSQRGYTKLVAMMDNSNDKKWDVMNNLIDDYFNMKAELKGGQPKSSLDLLKLQVQALEEVKGEVQGVRNELEEFKEDLPLIGSEPEELQKVVRKIGTRALGGYGSTAYKDKSISTKVYKSVWKYIKDQFNVNTYKAIKRKYLDKAKEIAESYEAPFYLQEEIDILNNQGKLDV